MSSGDEDGGPAFPRTGHASYHNNGMSLRDWFAGQALAGIANQWFHPGDETWAEIAAAAYGQADAMLAIRKDPRE